MAESRFQKARRSKRVVSKRRASLVVDLGHRPRRLPCLILDSSKEGFRLRGSFDLRSGQVVELILDGDDIPSSERCSVVWVGKAGSQQQGEVGLEIARRSSSGGLAPTLR